MAFLDGHHLPDCSPQTFVPAVPRGSACCVLWARLGLLCWANGLCRSFHKFVIHAQHFGSSLSATTFVSHHRGLNPPSSPFEDRTEVLLED